MKLSLNRKFKPSIGMVCTVDIYNTLKCKEGTSLDRVIVKERVKWKLFGRSIWKVDNIDNSDQKELFVPEFLLFPANMCIIRYPSDMPVFNEMDLAAIKRVIEYLETKTDSKLGDINRLKAVKVKIDNSLKMREV